MPSKLLQEKYYEEAMETVVFSYVRGSCEASHVHEIKAAYGEALPLNDANHLSDKLGKNNVYILSKFVKVLIPLKHCDSRKVLQLLFKEISDSCTNSSVDSKQFKVVVFNGCAQRVQEAISEHLIRPGDIVTFHRPTVMVLTKTIKENGLEREDSGVWIEMGAEDNQLINIWQAFSDSFIDSVRCKYSYRHLDIHDMDYVGSDYHAVRNLLHIVADRGFVMTLREIAADKSQQKKVALARLKKTLSSPKNFDLTGEVKMLFSEILLEKTGQTVLTSIFPEFTAIFSGELAKELHKAVIDRHLVPGDMVVFCHPIFEKVTSAPMKIEFLSNEEKPFIALKLRQYSDMSTASKVTGLQLHNHKYNQNSSTCNVTNKIESLLEIENFEILLFRDFINEVNILECISNYMEKFGTVETLENLYKQLNFNNKNENGVILAYFLKTVTPLKEQDKPIRAIIFLKEICSDHTWGGYFRLVLHNKLAAEVQKAIKSKKIVRGDIISLVHPVIHLNPKYTIKDFVAEEPFLLEIGGRRDREKVIVCKLNRSCCNSNVNKSTVRNCVPRNVSVNTQNFKKPFDKNNSVSDTSKESSEHKYSSCTNNIDQRNCGQSNESVQSVTKSNFKKPLDIEHLRGNRNATSVEQENKVPKSYINHNLLELCCLLENTGNYEKESSNNVNSITVGLSKSQNECSKKRTLNIEEHCSSVDNTLGKTFRLQSKCMKREHSKETIDSKVIKSVLRSIKGPALREMENNCVFPVFVTKPSLANRWDLISGYCYESCHNMHVYSAIKWDLTKDPLCPRCFLKLRLVLCFEMCALTSTGRHVKLLLVGEEAERILNVSCEMFLSSEKHRKSATKCLEKITSIRLDDGETRYKIKLSDVTQWELYC
ncbi:uncharacterized protein LOC124360018 [Homalodisca vitripennis]|uniref:uncharacterized protein LOC124360018 n=1 Tax=Homalodisca vitripennis TaxID=197043 RepID=UPI001EEBE60A|nr:uncharacterized protein LOC124360018 [Homalodisca vitripennis]